MHFAKWKCGHSLEYCTSLNQYVQCKSRSSSTMPTNSPATSSEDGKVAMLVGHLREKLKGHKTWSKKVGLNNDDFLAMFLRVKGFDICRALEALEKYYEHFEEYPAYVADFRSAGHLEYRPLLEKNVLVVLRQPCPDTGSVVCIFRNAAWDPDTCSLPTVRQLAMYMFQEIARMPQAQVAGCSLIADLDGFSWGHLRQFSPADMRHIARLLQGGIALRVAAIHIVNYPAMIMGLYYIAAAVMKEKLRRRFHFHKDVAALEAKLGFGKEGLPESLGGTRALEDVVDRSIEHRLVTEDVNYADYYA